MDSSSLFNEDVQQEGRMERKESRIEEKKDARTRAFIVAFVARELAES